MKSIGWIVMCYLLTACATGGRGSGDRAAGLRLWQEAHEALAAAQFGRADTVFTQLSREHPDTEAGREALFYVGVLRLDPRNPAWSAEQAGEPLDAYLALDSAGTVKIHRWPEAATLREIARAAQLAAAEPAPPPAAPPAPPPIARPPQVDSLQAEVARLRTLLQTSEARVREQQEELERIRRILSAPATRPNP